MSVTGNSRVRFFSFFSEKGGFLLSVSQKNLNKGGDGFPRDRQGMVAPSSLLGRVISEKFIFVSENRGKNSTCLATTPIEGHFVAGFGKKRLFSKKSRKNPDRFQKNSEYTVWKVFFRKRVNISPFFAYIRGGRESESKLFSKKVRFSLIVCRKNLNKWNEG